MDRKRKNPRITLYFIATLAHYKSKAMIKDAHSWLIARWIIGEKCLNLI